MAEDPSLGFVKTRQGTHVQLIRKDDGGVSLVDLRTLAAVDLDPGNRDALGELLGRAAMPGLEARDVPGEPCPAWRPGEDGSRWECVLGMGHGNPGEDPDYDGQRTVHCDESGSVFRIARCRRPAEHGLLRAWCAIDGHHKREGD
jgi:hypothetical protein